MHDFYKETGIMHYTSCVETPQQNSIVERKHQHILSTTRAIMLQSNLPKNFWNHVVCHTIYLINWQSSNFISGVSPF